MQSRIKQLVLAGVFAAVIFAATAYTHIPAGFNQAYIHIGDAFIYLAASVLSPWYAVAASAIGAGLADVMVAPIYVIPTVIIKSFMALMFTNRGKMLCRRNVLGVIFAGVICTVGYYITEVILYANWYSPLAAVPVGLIQPIASGIIYLAVAGFFVKNKLWSI